MDFFTLTAGGRYLEAGVSSMYGTSFRFTVSTAAAGDLGANEQRNRSSFFKCIGIPTESVASFSQSHSKEVAIVTSASQSPFTADGGITANPHVVLAITVADCLPVALFDTQSGGMALVHSGWKGTGIAAVALDLMRRNFESRVEDMVAVIGPGIGSCCYNVPEERASRFSSYGNGVVAQRNDEFFLDLKEANRNLLYSHGMKNIYVSNLCTSCSHFLGSYRRQGPKKFTRMLAVVGHF